MLPNLLSMRKHINVLFLFIFLGGYADAMSTDTIYHARIDTSAIYLRTFDEQALDEFKSDPDFRYGRPQEGMTPWARFLIWLGMILQQFFYYTTQTLVGKILLYTFFIGIILWVVLKLLNIEVKDIFYRTSASSKIKLNLSEENIHELDFDKLIRQAVDKEEYRDAVRLVFLFALKKLSDANQIQWQPGKTNDEYIAELKQHPALPRLRELRYYFDYAWYGHFDIDNQTYEDVDKTFQEFTRKIG
jgi:Domain of unknown function (DUF4129)